MDSLLNILSESSVEDIIYQLLGYICHQDKTILLGIGGNLVPLCPRCLGLHAGYLLTLLFTKFVFNKPINLNIPRNLFAIILSTSFAGIHWFLGFFSLIEINTTSRLLTGLISGSGFCLLLNSLKHIRSYLDYKITAWNKIVLVFLPGLFTSFSLLDVYILLLLTILLLVINNTISIIDSVHQIIRQCKKYNHSLGIKEEMLS